MRIKIIALLSHEKLKNIYGFHEEIIHISIKIDTTTIPLPTAQQTSQENLWVL